MNKKLYEMFCLYRHLRIVQTLVEEIETLDYYAENYDEKLAISLIDFCLTKYNREMKEISRVNREKVVVEDDPELYEKKTTQEINNDVIYIRDCLMIIGCVQSGIRESIEQVVKEIEG